MTKTRTVYWLAALVTAAFGTVILFEKALGINWGMWVAAVSIGLVVARTSAGKATRPHTLALLAWATLLASAQGFTTVEGHSPMIIAGTALLLGLAVTTLDDFAGAITLPSVVRTPFAAVGRVGMSFFSELVAAPRSIGGLRTRPRTRGVLLAIPVVLVLVALLSRADPILDSLRETMFGWLANWTIDEAFIFFVVLAAITLGAYALAAGPKEQTLPAMPDTGVPFRLGQTETRILVGSITAVLWLFVLLQLFSLTRDPAGMAGTGVTYAEYARRGFAELSVAAALVLGLILSIEVFRSQESAAASRNLELAALIGIEIILVLAFRRVLLYESAYGFTTDRLIAQAYMVVLAAAFLLLGLDLRRGAVSPAFGRHGMMLTLAAVTIFAYWNYEGWIAGKNFERARSGAELDVRYLGRLSIAAAPALVQERAALNVNQRAQLDSMLRCKKLPVRTHWYEWNLRREKARAALSSIAGACERNPTPLA